MFLSMALLCHVGRVKRQEIFLPQPQTSDVYYWEYGLAEFKDVNTNK
jgi:hypothetical protein